MTPGWRRAGRILARVAAALVVLLLVGTLVLRLWIRHRYENSSTAFLASFGDRAEPSAPEAPPRGGSWLRAAALVVELSPDESRALHAWRKSSLHLDAADAERVRVLLDRERLARELLARAVESERIDLYFGPPERLEVERMADLVDIGELGALVNLFVAEELDRRTRGDVAGACESLERLGRLGRGLRKGRFLHEQIVASLPEAIFLHRIHLALSVGAPLPCLDSLVAITEDLDPSESTRRALVAEGRLQLLPHRLQVLPAESFDGAARLLSTLFFTQGNSLVRAQVLDAARAVLTEPDESKSPIEDPARHAERDLAGSLRDTFRVQLRQGELADARRRLALGALRVRRAIEAGDERSPEGIVAREPEIPLTGTRLALRSDPSSGWVLELPGSELVAQRFGLPPEQRRLFRWSVLPPIPGSP